MSNGQNPDDLLPPRVDSQPESQPEPLVFRRKPRIIHTTDGGPFAGLTDAILEFLKFCYFCIVGVFALFFAFVLFGILGPLYSALLAIVVLLAIIAHALVTRR